MSKEIGSDSASVLFPLTQTALAADPADAPVQRLNTALLEAMVNADTLGYNGRFDLLSPVLQDAFNFGLMARAAVGRAWKHTDNAQRARLVDVFTRLSIAEFASHFDGFSGERFGALAQHQGQRGFVLMENQLVESSGEAQPINYLVREFDGKWRIFDVRLDATISELALKRAEYTSVLRSVDVNGFVQMLEWKIVELAVDV